MDLKTILDIVGVFAKKHDTELEIGAGMVLGTCALISTSIATHQSDVKVAEVKAEMNVDHLTFKDNAKATWKYWIPPAMLKFTSDACLIFACKSHREHVGALTAAYTLTETAFKEYRRKVQEEVGAKKETEISRQLMQEKVNNSPVVNPNNTMLDGKGSTLCYDAVIDRYFWSEKEKIDAAVNFVNRRVAQDDWCDLNEFYFELNIKECTFGDRSGVKREDYYKSAPFEVDYYTVLCRDGRTPCLAISYRWTPKDMRY